MTKVDAVKVPGDPSRRLLMWAALVWLVSHYRHDGYGAEFRHLLPILLLYVIVFGCMYVGQLHFAHRARVRRATGDVAQPVAPSESQGEIVRE